MIFYHQNIPKRNDVVTSRRFLPAVGWLAAFEAVARRGSVTDAADELALSQSAVTRQIQKLEDSLSVPLFVRDRKRLVLTAAGAAYAEEVRSALATITNATVKLRSNPEGGTLELSILPAFGTHWLAPRLPDFLEKNPGVTINLSTRIVPFDFDTERFHAAIHYGKADWIGADVLKLMDEETIAVAAPELFGVSGGISAEEVAALPLLHLQTRPDAWTEWLKGQGLDAPPQLGMGFDQFGTMVRAAISGIGVALVPKYIVLRELELGRLVAMRMARPVQIGAYYLVWPRTGADYPPVVAFRAWLAQQR